MNGTQIVGRRVGVISLPSSAFPNDREQSAVAEDSSPSFDVKIVDPTLDAGWDALVAGHKLGSIFHTAAWARVLKDSYGHQPVYLVISHLGEPAALLPIMEVTSPVTGRRGVALPFSDFCGALFFDGFEMNSIQKHLTTVGRGRAWKYFEVRGDAGHASDVSAAPTFLGHSLSLKENAQELHEGFSSPVRRNLAKAERSGLAVQITRGAEAVSQFYKLHVRTRRRHGSPPQPVRFFDNIFRHLIEPGLGFVVTAGPASGPLAASVFLTSGENAVYKFGASDERFQEHRANNLVMWEAIKYLCASGIKTLHFGRTSPDNAGLRRFKLGWGAQERAIDYSRLDPTTGDWRRVEPDSQSVAATVFRRLPITINRWAGSVLYPHLD